MKMRILLPAFIFAFFGNYCTSLAEPSAEDALSAMKKASDFMANAVSTQGGYVDMYSADLSQRWGEVPARDTQIWCQPPGTPAMGTIYLEAYTKTGEKVFLHYAEMAADALIWGQHPEGGWHYLIDFDMPGIRKWYDDVASKCWGWEEYYHYYGNCSFDDQATTGPAEFLLDLYMATLDPKYRIPVIKALDFIVEAQYPNGAWPQRYPLMYDYPHDGHGDYTHYYTFNDGVIHNNIFLLFEAWERLGIENYREAAVRGMDFYLISQLPDPQAGWAQQYSMDMKPAAARSYEPAAVSTNRTLSNMNDLFTFYTMTGDRRYLEPIPHAIAWLERSVINTDASGKYTHAGFYEPGTNEPLYYHFKGTGPDDHVSWINHDREGAWWYRKSVNVDLVGLKRRYNRYKGMSPDEALSEYEASKQRSSRGRKPDPADAERIISSLDGRGAWITDMRVRQYDKGMLDPPPVVEVDGIDVSVFIRNMSVLIDYLAE